MDLMDGAGKNASADSLSARIVRGIAWGWSSNGINTVLNIAILTVLARLLTPKDFGLMASTSVLINFLHLFIDLGISAKIIQKQDPSHGELSSIFYINLLTGFLLAGITIIVAPFAANFYYQQALKNLVALMSLSFVVTSVGSVSHALLQKQMRFDKIARVDITSTIAYGLATISMAYFGLGAISLALGFIIRSLWGSVNYIISARWLPGRWHGFGPINEYITFGAFVSGSKFFNFLATNIDYILIGRFFGPGILGLYTLAYQLVTFPLTKISRTISTVTLPAFSELQSDDSKLSDLFLKIIRQASTIIFPLLAGLFAVAPEFVGVFYGEKWVGSIVLIQLLCLAGTLKSIGTLVSNIYVVKNRVGLALVNQIIYFSAFAIAIYLSIPYGIYYVAASISLAQIPIFIIFQIVAHTLINLRLKEYFAALRPSIFGSAMVIIFVYTIKLYFKSLALTETTVTLTALVIVGMVAYFGYFYAIEKKGFHSLLNELRLKV